MYSTSRHVNHEKVFTAIFSCGLLSTGQCLLGMWVIHFNCSILFNSQKYSLSAMIIFWHWVIVSGVLASSLLRRLFVYCWAKEHLSPQVEHCYGPEISVELTGCENWIYRHSSAGLLEIHNNSRNEFWQTEFVEAYAHFTGFGRGHEACIREDNLPAVIENINASSWKDNTMQEGRWEANFFVTT